MKVVHHHANGSFDRLISGQRSVDPLREVIYTAYTHCWETKKMYVCSTFLIRNEQPISRFFVIEKIIDILDLETFAKNDKFLKIKRGGAHHCSMTSGRNNFRFMSPCVGPLSD